MVLRPSAAGGQADLALVHHSQEAVRPLEHSGVQPQVLRWRNEERTTKTDLDLLTKKKKQRQVETVAVELQPCLEQCTPRGALQVRIGCTNIQSHSGKSKSTLEEL